MAKVFSIYILLISRQEVGELNSSISRSHITQCAFSFTVVESFCRTRSTPASNLRRISSKCCSNSDLIDIVNGRVTLNEAHIAQNKRRVDENKVNMDELDLKVDTLDVKVKEDEASLDSLAVKIQDLHEAPLGTITAWVTKPSSGGMEASLPDGWQKCDGSLISAPSLWEGKVTPNLNGERRFLRGGSDADMLKLEEDQLQEHTHKVNDPGHNHQFTDRYTVNNGEHDGPDDGNGLFGYPHSAETAIGSTGGGCRIDRHKQKLQVHCILRNK